MDGANMNAQVCFSCTISIKLLLKMLVLSSSKVSQLDMVMSLHELISFAKI